MPPPESGPDFGQAAKEGPAESVDREADAVDDPEPGRHRRRPTKGPRNRQTTDSMGTALT